MLQDIQPMQYSNAFTPRLPEDDDLVFAFQKDRPLLFGLDDMQLAPTVSMMQQTFDLAPSDFTYLFSIDDTAVFLLKDITKVQAALPEAIGFAFHPLNIFRTLDPRWIGFAGVTASHLAKWYASNRFCGCCGSTMSHSKTERAMVCDQCGFTDYPKICPAVIVAVRNGEKVMLTKYANRAFTRYALIAGFCEIGETIEQTVAREVLEEVGVHVKNIRYYGCQPWGFSESLLLGFVCDLDGDETVTMDANELKVAEWKHVSEIPDDNENELSLTYTMMQALKRGEDI